MAEARDQPNQAIPIPVPYVPLEIPPAIPIQIPIPVPYVPPVITIGN